MYWMNSVLFSYSHRRTSDDVWIGMRKHANSNFWYPTMHDICKEENITLPGQLFHERQCAVLNMSGNSYSGNFNIMYAAACEEKFLGFVCLANYGLVPSGKILLQTLTSVAALCMELT